MDITTLDIGDPDQRAGLVALLRAEQQADTPDRDPADERALVASIELPADGTDYIRRIATVDGRLVGYLELGLPTKDNLHLCWGEISVHPEHRRRGIGSALMAEAMELARGRGRRTLTMNALTTGPWPGTPTRDEAPAAFLAAHGFEVALRSVNRRTDLSTLDYQEIDRRHDAALAASTEYETIAWHGRVPEDLLAPLAVLNSTFLAEVPSGDFELEAETIDAERMRANDDRSLARGLFMCGVVARRKGDTAIVANTVLGKRGASEEIAHQWMTLVAPEHRGHKLGLRLKIENLRQLRELRPSVRYIDTDNADTNEHMIAINDLLGFRPVDYLLECQRRW